MTLKATLGFAQILLVINFTPDVIAADRTWTGGGGDDFWSSPANWGGAGPAAGDSLFFGGSIRTSPNNDFPPGTTFSGLTIDNPAGLFTLRGNSITLGGNIVDDMPLVPQTNLMMLTLNTTRIVTVVTNGLLTLGGIISGAGAGLTKTGGGQLVLNAINTFSGPVTINDGALTISSDLNLGAAPASPAPGQLTLNGGALRGTASITLNANRGIALGDGTIDVAVGRTLTYGGVIANNGVGNLSKLSFGNLVLSGANTYTGTTAIKNGTLTLDFAAAGAPANNIISSSSHLTMGRENAGLGTTNFSALIVNGKANAANSQTFNGTTIDIGAQVIRAISASGGSANIHLGELTPLVGGDVTFVPPVLGGGSGNLTTTTTNVNGILGGWALIGDGSQLNGMTIGTNWGKVDGSGNIVNYDMASYVKSDGGNIHGTVTAADNLLIDDTSGGGATTVQFAPDNANTFTEVNTINIRKSAPWTLRIGTSNTVRLGRYGSIFKSDTSTHVWTMGQGDGGVDAPGSQDFAGTLTAGGADNTSGVIIFNLNQSNQGNANHHNCYARITDNGTAPVAVVKAGSAPFKLGGHNTYSGGTYMIQGRIQLGGGFVGTGNPDGFGSGPVYVFPGAYLYLNPGAGQFTNELFIAGNGTQPEPLGCIRFQSAGWVIASTVTLIGDATIGGNNGNISGQITGPFNLTIGSGATVQGSASFSNPNNDWRGNTTLQARSGQSGSFISGGSEVIPHGLGFGNVTMLGIGTITWNLNGFTETINGLLTAGNAATCFIVNNNTGTNAVLVVGDYDQTGTFGGAIQNGASGAGVLSLTKIGGGRQTLTGNNTYTGPTTVNGGTLALTGSGSIASSQEIVVNDATLDVSGVNSSFATVSPLAFTNGIFLVRTTAPLTSLTLARSRVSVAGLGSSATVIDAASLITDGPVNLIDIASVGTISAYPATFRIIKYGALSGAGFNFALGNVPTPSTFGYVTNNETEFAIDLVLLDGPKALTWRGSAGPAWDIDSTVNWLAFGVTPSVFLDVDSVRFDDTGSLSAVNLTTNVQPSAIVVNNEVLNYSFTGTGKIGGPASLTKEGAGTLTIVNSGTNDFFGPITINGGAVQVGSGGTVGNLGIGPVINNGRLLFSRSDNPTISSVISGSGSIEHIGSGILTLAGASDFTGQVMVTLSALRAGSDSAFGTGDGATVVADGATLDINGQNLTSEPVIVSGSGVGGSGAIVNSGLAQINALRTVTLAGDVVFGGAERWDIRNVGGGATLMSGGSPFKITKVGPNQVSLVGVTVDGALGEIDVQEGIFSVQNTTAPLGDAFNTLTIHGNATLGLFNLNPLGLNKVILLRDGATVFNENGRSLVDGAISLEGNITFNAANAGTTPALVLNGPVDGAGALVKIGAGTLVIAGVASHTGATLVNGGTLLVDGSVNNTAITVSGGTLGGAGAINTPVTIAASGSLAPGNLISPLAMLTVDVELTLVGTTVMDVNKSGGAIVNDSIGGFSTLSFGGALQLILTGEPLAGGDVIQLFGFGAASGAFASISPSIPGPGMKWDTSGLGVDGTLKVVSFRIGAVTTSGNQIGFSGTGGTPGAEYRVLSSTNVALPLINWEPVATNVFDLDGNFSFSQAIDPAFPQRFYLLTVP